LASLPSYETRLNWTAALLNKTVPIGIEHIVTIAQRFHTKLLLGEKYLPSKKLSCRTTLFRAEISSEFGHTIGDDYGLTNVRNLFR
jgi:hypothetical protein